MSFDSVGQVSKSVLANPVVVMIVATWKTEFLSVLQSSPVMLNVLTQITATVAGTRIRNLNNPAAYANVTYTADEDGYIIVAKDNIGASGLGSYVYNRTEKWT